MEDGVITACSLFTCPRISLSFVEPLRSVKMNADDLWCNGTPNGLASAVCGANDKDKSFISNFMVVVVDEYAEPEMLEQARY
jgi:hypothetical protein